MCVNIYINMYKYSGGAAYHDDERDLRGQKSSKRRRGPVDADMHFQVPRNKMPTSSPLVSSTWTGDGVNNSFNLIRRDIQGCLTGKT